MHESLTGRHNGVRSVFAVKQCPGRIYIEANCINSARELLKRTPLVFWNNVYVVSETEREDLLNPKTPSTHALGDWVKIWSGLYRGDVGQIVHVDNDQMYEVTVVPRIAPRPTRPRGKRPRTQKTRVPAQRMKPNNAVLLFGGKATLTEDGYKYQGHFYGKNGLRELYIRHDAFEAYRPTMTEISPFIDIALEKIVAEHEHPMKVNGKEVESYEYTDIDLWNTSGISYDKLRIESLLEVGDEIEIVRGHLLGMFGHVAEILENDTIRAIMITDEGEIEIHKAVDDIRPAIRQGDPVTIKIGVLAGRSGLVEVINGTDLIIRESSTLREVFQQNKSE